MHNSTKITINKKLIYVDNNVISTIENNKELFYEMVGLSDKFQIIYSPINIEEIAKREKGDNTQILNKISELTNNIGIFRVDNENISLLKEDPEYSYNRIKEIGIEVNKSLESYRKLVNCDNTVRIEDNKYNMQKYRDLINSNDNILENKECREIFSKALIKYGNLSLKDYEELPKLYLESYTNLNSSIYAIMNAMMFIGYKTDKSSKKKDTISSGLYDVEHLIFAAKSNVFITRDKKFFQRAKIIFKILNINTELIYFKDKEIIDILKSL